MKIITTENKPIKSWCDNPEEGAIEQAKNLANLPFIYKHVALMPDTHQGYGMPIGGVMACTDVIIPNAVGVDIGCGMRAVKTNLKDISPERLKEIMIKIRQKIPVGKGKWHSEYQDEKNLPLDFNSVSLSLGLQENIMKEYNKALKQLGTLGGGNHFIEIQRGSDDNIWFMIHSGSRNLGYTVARYYNNIAKEINKKWYTKIEPAWDLAFLPKDSREAASYLDEMLFCLDFAKANRKLMAERVKESFEKGVEFLEEYDVHHNYVDLENHFKKNLWIHRKGATSAREGEIGIIPGSQGTASYIVRGLGNKESFMSCSHGAGRKMGRKAAQRELNLEAEIKKLDDQGIIHSIRSEKDLDEASSAYKDIDIVMEEQKDLVEILVKLKPLAVVKG